MIFRTVRRNYFGTQSGSIKLIYEHAAQPPGRLTKARHPMADDKDSIRVEIYDESYNLRGSDPAYIQRLAEIVDAKMRAVAQHTSTVDSLRVAVLAALNIADDYSQLKRKYEGIESDYTTRASHLGRALDSALNEVLLDTRRAG
jgi:cell division protein ZapA